MLRLGHPDPRPQGQEVAKPGPEPRSFRLNLLPHNSLQPPFFWNTQIAVGSASWSKRGAHPALCFPPHGAPGQAQVRIPPGKVFVLPGPAGSMPDPRAQSCLGRCLPWPVAQLRIQTLRPKSLRSLQSRGLKKQECERASVRVLECVSERGSV